MRRVLFGLLAVCMLTGAPANAAIYSLPTNGTADIVGELPASGYLFVDFGNTVYATLSSDWLNHPGGATAWTSISPGGLGSVSSSVSNQPQSSPCRYNLCGPAQLWLTADITHITVTTSISANGTIGRPSAAVWIDLPDTFHLENVVSFASSVPEPTTWAMMLLGFAAIGGTAMCRHQTRVIQAART